jgi:hypothetical protein
MNRNALTRVDYELVNSSSLEFVNLESNQITAVASGAFPTSVGFLLVTVFLSLLLQTPDDEFLLSFSFSFYFAFFFFVLAAGVGGGCRTLSNNKLTRLQRGMFSNLGHVILYLAFNMISEIEIGSLPAAVLELDLRGNLLTRFHPRSLPSAITRM